MIFLLVTPGVEKSNFYEDLEGVTDMEVINSKKQ
jgi:hypothetical protein